MENLNSVGQYSFENPSNAADTLFKWPNKDDMERIAGMTELNRVRVAILEPWIWFFKGRQIMIITHVLPFLPAQIRTSLLPGSVSRMWKKLGLHSMIQEAVAFFHPGVKIGVNRKQRCDIGTTAKRKATASSTTCCVQTKKVKIADNMQTLLTAALATDEAISTGAHGVQVQEL